MSLKTNSGYASAVEECKRLQRELEEAQRLADVRGKAVNDLEAELEAHATDRVNQRAEVAALREIVERIMTQHWDMAACSCWVCRDGREAGCRPRVEYLLWRGKFGFVGVKEGKS